MAVSAPTKSSQRTQADAPLCILIVDGDTETRAFYRQCVAADGYDVVEAADGREALAKALMRPPLLVITEITLPFVNGYALCDILRHDRATARAAILVVTADPRAAQLNRARQAGADAVLLKPTTPDAILAELRRLLSDKAGGGDPSRADAAAETTQSQRPAEPPARGAKPMALARQYRRFATTTPPVAPPSLVCPFCDHPLVYEQSHVGGVSLKHHEQWDYFSCASCGPFQYRQRTRRLRPVS